MAKKVIVVRVGTREVQIVHMEYKKSYPIIYGCVRFPTPPDSIQDGMIIDVPELAMRIRKVCEEKNIRTRNVIFTIASGKIASREMTIPYVKKQEKVQTLVMAKVPDLFPIDAEKYIFSYVTQGKPYKDAEGSMTQDVMVFAAPSDLIDSYYTLADAAGLHIEALEADGNAVFQVMRRQTKKEVSMSVQINQTVTLVNIISNDKLLLQRVIPYGINVFTEVMVQEPAFQTKTDEEAYTLLKRNQVILPTLNMKNESSDPTLAKRIEVTDNASYLISNIARVIEYYNSKYKDQPIEEVICMGQGSAVAGFHKLLSNELMIQTYTPDELAGVTFNRKININAYILQYISCFGSVFEPVNFESKAIARKAQRKGSLTVAVLLFVLFLVASVSLGGFSILTLKQAQSENSTWSNRYNAMSPIQTEYDELTSVEDNYALLDDMEDAVTTNNNGFHDLLKEIESLCPKTFKIQSFSSDETSVTVNAVSTDKLLSLSALQIQLNKIEGIENVKLDAITETNEALTKKKQYSYTMTFDYTVEVEEEETDTTDTTDSSSTDDESAEDESTDTE